MMVQLLPILFVANVSVNESDWKYGPELIYDVSMNGTEYRIVDEMINIFVHNTTMKLKCRPKNQTNFSCLLHEPRVISSVVESDGNYCTVNDSKIYRDKNPCLADYSFEFNVDRKGYGDRHLVVTSSSINEQRLDIVRTLMDMINIPARILTLPKGWSIGHVKENSTIGIRCKTQYSINPEKLLDGFEINDKKRSYEILLESGEKIQKGRGHSIVRYRYPDQCYAGYRMTGTYSNHYPGEIYRFMTRTDMIASDNTVVSKDTSRFRWLDRYPGRDSPIGLETISLRLEDIVQANGPLPVIRNPMTFGMSGTGLFHSNDAQEWLFMKNSCENNEELSSETNKSRNLGVEESCSSIF